MIEKIPDLENRCITCKRRAYTKLCDFVIGSFKTSIDFQERTLTCDAKICDKCAVQIGPGFDFCHKHAKEAQTALSNFNPYKNLFN